MKSILYSSQAYVKTTFVLSAIATNLLPAIHACDVWARLTGSSKKRKFEAPPFDEDFARGLVLSLKGLEGHGWDREAIKKGCEAHGPVG